MKLSQMKIIVQENPSKESMKNILIEIEYDGSNYCGWQVQTNGATIQQKIEEAIENLTGEKLRINGAGRTDAGVHAFGQTATFQTATSIPPTAISKSLNPRLPDDISIISSKEVPSDFHARFSAKGKIYRYVIFNRQQRSPFQDKKSFRYGKSIDIEAMQSAANHFIGTKDFRAFMAAGSSVIDTTRTIYRLEVRNEGQMIFIETEGNGFLYNMVRIIAGTLLECGEGKINPEAVSSIIDSLDRENAGRTLPGYGLYLVKVIY